ncbi:RBBP9/YdeN family alpha/beta hydrolase [Rubrivivax gelatinosus]|uniref:Alpha/beta hydrolase n=1 Tax=Rubrivivax gelatinosus TaxID=28068 RepID=A0ABS1DNN8_RUBGE|nr:alpha/beta hydrolase [Rubrivivax gelatinosus]MBK1711622.1 alpha/beta hydrolase [Rubrivivax gelatinosus]
MTLDERVLVLPGWLGSGPQHWQSRWEALHGFVRVQQSDWEWPLRGDWMAQLEDAVLAAPGPVRLAAHSLGCHLVSAWAAHSRHTARIAGALLVAPPDLERDETPLPVARWRPALRQALPFPARVLYSDDDPFATPEASRGLAADWGAVAESLGARGHLNAESGLGDWPEGVARLAALAAR